MNRNKLQSLASEWVRIAKNDIRNKVLNFLREVDATPRELALHLGISDGELQQIIEGNGEITLTTFAKLLIATGNALEIKPIEETPIGNYENMPSEDNTTFSCPNAFERQRPTHINHFARPSHTRNVEHPFDERMFSHMPPPPPPSFMNPFDFDDDEEDITEEPIETRRPQPRDEHGRFAPSRNNENTTRAPRGNASPFENMTTDELTDIIKERLWDSEINLARATKRELVDFLTEKDKKINEYKRMRELENDPTVNEFKNRIKRTVENNPHLREWTKKFLGELGA